MPYGQPRGTKRAKEPPTATPESGTQGSGGSGNLQVDLEPLIAKVGMVEKAVQGVAGAVNAGNVPVDDQISGAAVINTNQVMVVNNRRYFSELYVYGTLIITAEAELTIWDSLKIYGKVINHGILKG